MKQNTKNTNITAISRKSGWLPLAAFAAMLAACTAGDDTLPTDGSSDTPVTFTTGIQIAQPAATPRTRTAIGADGQTVWKEGDAVGVFMLSAGGTIPGNIILGADNIKYNVAPSTGALSPAGTPAVYYPQSGKVDFIALYPYSDKGTGNGKITPEYKYAISVTGQTNPEAIDVLYAKATEKGRTKSPVELSFKHVLSKIKLDIKPGEGLTGLAANQITAVTLTGMPASATLALQDGTLTPGAVGNIPAMKEENPSAGATATFTFTALVPPQEGGSYTRSIIVTVNGEVYTGTIPDADVYESNGMYTYPVTVQKTGITVGKSEIGKWETNDHGSGNAEISRVSSQQAIARFKEYFYQDGKVHANRLNSFQDSEWALATDDARKPLDIFMEITGVPVSMKSQYEYSYQSSDGKCNINIKGSAEADTEAVFATINVYIPEYKDIETMHIVTIDYFKGDNSDDIVTGVPVIYAK